jgi:hypothetical protein
VCEANGATAYRLVISEHAGSKIVFVGPLSHGGVGAADCLNALGYVPSVVRMRPTRGKLDLRTSTIAGSGEHAA